MHAAPRFPELFLLTGFALAQPVFALLAPHPEFFAAHEVERLELATLVLLLTCALPLLVIGLASLAASHAEAIRSAAHTLLIAATVAQPLAPFGSGDAGAVVVLLTAVALGCAGALLLRSAERLRVALGFASLLALSFPVIFLASESVRPLLVATDAAEFRGPAIDSTTPVVLLVLDELPLASLLTPSGEIDSERFPHFASLANDAYWFRNATTVANSTGFATAALLTGNRPARTIAPRGAAYPKNLFSLLANGRDVLILEGPTGLCPSWLCDEVGTTPPRTARIATLLSDVAILYAHSVVPSAWSAALPPVRERWKGFADGEGPGLPSPAATQTPTQHEALWRVLEARQKAGLPRLAAALRALHGGARPTLLFVQLMMPHPPWQYLPNGRAYMPVTYAHGMVEGLWSGPEWESIQGLQRHLMQTMYTDRLLGHLLDELKEVGLYDEAMVVVAADHGGSFAHGSFGRRLTDENFADVLSVPFFIKRPGQRRAVVDDRNAETIDLVPTIAQELGIAVPWSVQGRSLFDDIDVNRRQKVAMQVAELADLADPLPDRHFGVAALEAARSRTVERIWRWFGAGERGLFDAVPGNDPALRRLLGAELATLTLRRTAPGSRVQLLSDSWYEQVDASNVSPAHVMGRTRADSSRPNSDLAIAINGRIEAVTQTYLDAAGWAWFTAMVREAAVPIGDNEVEIFELQRDAGAVALVPMSREPYSGFAAPTR